ncbi:MAG: hypothetical protein LBM27_04310 [Lactobacillaceae bacterium]|jgi:hypothetical protein|nr:hypothetical protein [Lactobacillaceae bacterium]
MEPKTINIYRDNHSLSLGFISLVVAIFFWFSLAENGWIRYIPISVALIFALISFIPKSKAIIIRGNKITFIRFYVIRHTYKISEIKKYKLFEEHYSNKGSREQNLVIGLKKRDERKNTLYYVHFNNLNLTKDGFSQLRGFARKNFGDYIDKNQKINNDVNRWNVFRLAVCWAFGIFLVMLLVVGYWLGTH